MNRKVIGIGSKHRVIIDFFKLIKSVVAALYIANFVYFIRYYKEILFFRVESRDQDFFILLALGAALVFAVNYIIKAVPELILFQPYNAKYKRKTVFRTKYRPIYCFANILTCAVFTFISVLVWKAYNVKFFGPIPVIIYIVGVAIFFLLIEFNTWSNNPDDYYDMALRNKFQRIVKRYKRRKDKAEKYMSGDSGYKIGALEKEMSKIDKDWEYHMADGPV